jgi:arylsulfatase A-like enzyme
MKAPGLTLPMLLLLGVAFIGMPAAAQQNVLLLIMDDVGVDNVGVYAEHPDPANTPVLDQLAADGLLFRNAWANPMCSPTRATMLTGRYSWRTGLGIAMGPVASDALPLDELTLPELLPPAYGAAAVGKWHLGNDLTHPQETGFQHHWGSMAGGPASLGGGSDYYDFKKNVDGVEVQSTTYATTDTVDDALTLMGMLGEPWLLWVGFNAAHIPFHKPPPALHTYNLPAQIAGNEPIHSKAAIEAMDTEIGRLLASMDPAVRANTVVVVVGDNGPVSAAVTAPWDPAKAKKTVFDGGLRVPLLVSGPGVAQGAECTALVNTTDLFATVADVTGAVPPAGTDSTSLVPYFGNPALPSMRDFAYAELFEPNFSEVYLLHHRAAREQRFKLVYEYVPFAPDIDRELLFDLQADPFETTNLLDAPLSAAAQLAYDDLRAVMTQQEPTPSPGPWTMLGGGTIGSAGSPALRGAGPLTAGSLASLTLTDARASALTLALGSFASMPFITYGGYLHTVPFDLALLFFTDGTGELVLATTWPPGMPAGTQLWFQCLVDDPTAAFGIGVSNGVQALTP